MRYRLYLILILFNIPGLAWAQTAPTNLSLFTISGEPHPVDEFVYLYNKNHQGRSEEFTKEKIESYLELYINFKLKVKEAEARGLDQSMAFKTELAGYKEELKKPFIAEPDLLDQLVKETYQRLGEEIKVSHILIGVKPDAPASDTIKAYNRAMDVYTKAKEGEAFEKLAIEFSEDPSVKVNNGSLGYFTALQMVFPFEQAAYQMNVGEISKPVRSQFGYHIIRVEDRRPSSGEVEVSHILKRGNEESAKALIYDVYQKITQGGDWNILCKEFSDDPETKENGGRLRPFGPGALASAPQFEAVAFSLKEPGSISAPFQTAFGWHIIRLERKIPLPAFEEMEPSLKRRVARDERLLISKSAQTEKRKKELGFSVSHRLNEMLEQFADSSLLKGLWKAELIKENQDSVLFSLGSTAYTMKDFGHYMEANQSRVDGNIKERVDGIFNLFIEESLMEEEDRRLQESNPDYRNLVNEYREGILLFNIMEREVWNKASEDSIGQRNYYQANLERYQAGERLKCSMYSTASKTLRDSTALRIQHGDSLAVKDSRIKMEAENRAFERGDHQVVDRIEWSQGLRTAEAEGMYYLVLVKEVISPGPKKFEETRAAVISDFQDHLEREWIKQLKVKYIVKVNAKGKKKALSNLIPQTAKMK